MRIQLYNMANMFGLGCRSKNVVDQVVKPTTNAQKKPKQRPPKACVLQSALKHSPTILPSIEEEDQNIHKEGCVCF